MPRLPPLVERTVQRLIRAFAAERIVLFGSHAKNAVQVGSDVDLLVVASLEGNPAHHLRRARQLASDCFPPVDIVFARPEELAEASAVASPFLASILGRGITIYARDPKAEGHPVSQPFGGRAIERDARGGRTPALAPAYPLDR